jgi:hypothetical protein
MGVTPGGLGGCNPPEFEVGAANVLQPPEFHQDTAIPLWQPPLFDTELRQWRYDYCCNILNVALLLLNTPFDLTLPVKHITGARLGNTGSPAPSSSRGYIATIRAHAQRGVMSLADVVYMMLEVCKLNNFY